MPRKRPVTVRRRRKPTRHFPTEPLGLADVEALRAVCSPRALAKAVAEANRRTAHLAVQP
jgi:hypothetical protein